MRPASFNDELIKDILAYGNQSGDSFETISANTMSTDCFYEGQGRTDGAVCEYDDAAKMEFLQKCHKLGIRNIEMEATMFASMTQKVGVKAADVCVTLINRLNGDQVSATCCKPTSLYIYNSALRWKLLRKPKRTTSNDHS